MGQKVNIKIGERSYSLTAATPEKERVFRLAADSVNRRYDELVRKFVGTPPIELMSMVALNESIGRIEAQLESSRSREDVSALAKQLGQYLDQH